MATDVQPRQKIPSVPPDRRRSWPDRIAAALPGAFLALVFGFFFITKTSEAWTATKSVQAMLLIAGIIVGWVLLAWLLRRFVRWVWIRAAILSVVAVAIAVLTIRPYYVETVDNTKLVKGPVQDASQAAPAAPGPAAPAPEPAAPVRVSTGRLGGIGHSASGEASIIRQPNGSFVVRFSNFDIEGSPDPIVYVLEGEGKRDPGGVDLGRLRGNVGTDSDYAVPQGTEPGPGWTVLVWCRAFAVPIANATQAAA
jgi:Electron transfer DM13